MNYKLILGMYFACAIASCKHGSRETELQTGQDAVKSQYTSYTNHFELFAEADAFVVGEYANVLSHFSTLPDFKAVEKGQISIVLSVNGKVTTKTLDKPTRKGIYSFDIKPEMVGKGSLKFEITNDKGTFDVIVPDVTVFASNEEALKAAEGTLVSRTNATVFTKEQSWKIDFATDFPKTGPFGQIIKTTALVQSAQGSEVVVTAKTNGIVMLSSNNLLEGKAVSAGQVLCSISGNDLAENNISVKFTEAKSNYEKAKADYDRASELSMDKIVSTKDLQTARNHYENAKAIYDNLNLNFNTSGQSVTSPLNGFIKQLLVKNGMYVEAGQPVLVVSQNKTLVLTADLPQKYASVLSTFQSANIRIPGDNKTYTLKELNGRILSYGKAASNDNYLLPVNFQIDNGGNFIPGSFVEVYLKVMSNKQALIIPNTSIIEEQGYNYTWVQLTPELFEKREIVVGKTDGLSSEVIKGISATDRIITKGAILVKLAQATGTLDAHSGHVH